MWSQKHKKNSSGSQHEIPLTSWKIKQDHLECDRWKLHTLPARSTSSRPAQRKKGHGSEKQSFNHSLLKADSDFKLATGMLEESKLYENIHCILSPQPLIKERQPVTNRASQTRTFTHHQKENAVPQFNEQEPLADINLNCGVTFLNTFLPSKQKNSISSCDSGIIVKQDHTNSWDLTKDNYDAKNVALDHSPTASSDMFSGLEFSGNFDSSNNFIKYSKITSDSSVESVDLNSSKHFSSPSTSLDKCLSSLENNIDWCHGDHELDNLLLEKNSKLEVFASKKCERKPLKEPLAASNFNLKACNDQLMSPSHRLPSSEEKTARLPSTQHKDRTFRKHHCQLQPCLTDPDEEYMNLKKKARHRFKLP